jgi:Flp pilus assembly protein TadG
MLLMTVSVDFCRVFHHYSIVTNAARNAALYASDSTAALDSPYYVAGDRTQSIRNAALADAGNLNAGTLTVATTETSSYVEVTVTYPVPMVTSYLGFSSKTVGRTVRMSVAPNIPN